jgi:hypothetical protein
MELLLNWLLGLVVFGIAAADMMLSRSGQACYNSEDDSLHMKSAWGCLNG